MKLLFDQNISFRVVRKIIQDFPLAISVWDVGFMKRTIFQFGNMPKKTAIQLLRRMMILIICTEFGDILQKLS